jgi:hypothetical protein
MIKLSRLILCSFILSSLALMVFSMQGCHDDEPNCATCKTFSTAYVIGFDPCTAIGGNPTGELAILLRVNNDTLPTYTFRKGIYEFPQSYFADYRSNCFFPDSTATDFPLQIKYRQAAENEMTYLYVPGIL